MTQVLAIGIGGAIGSLLRFWMSTWVHSFAGRGFPYGTLTVNVLGCLVMGVLFVLSVYYFPYGIVGQLRASAKTRGAK